MAWGTQLIGYPASFGKLLKSQGGNHSVPQRFRTPMSAHGRFDGPAATTIRVLNWHAVIIRTTAAAEEYWGHLMCQEAVGTLLR